MNGQAILLPTGESLITMQMMSPLNFISDFDLRFFAQYAGWGTLFPLFGDAPAKIVACREPEYRGYPERACGFC
jgi:hypothetical protein